MAKRVIYHLALFLGLLFFLPRILWRKKWSVLRERFRTDAPDPKGRRAIWIHAVSVGEVKSASGLMQRIKTEHPDLFVLVTTCTAMGLAEAKRSLAKADAIRYLPFDFHWLIQKWVVRLKPALLIFVEGDIWPHLVQAVKQHGGNVVLVSGKVSDRSAARWMKIRYWVKQFVSLFDLLIVQNEHYYQKFKPFVGDIPRTLTKFEKCQGGALQFESGEAGAEAAKLKKFSDAGGSQIQWLPDAGRFTLCERSRYNTLHIGGNLKFDATAEPVDRVRFAHLFQDIGFGIALVSTHAPEELELLDALQSIDATLFLAPRHPERFLDVAAILEAKNISYCLWSRIEQRRGGERVFLIDAMGQLPLFFAFSHLAIVAGSFSSRIGGHNVLEPCLYGVPVLFGPHMHQQREFAQRVLATGAGRQVHASEIAAAVRAYRENPLPMRNAARTLIEQSGGSLQTTWSLIQKFLAKKEKTLGINHLSC